MSIQTGIVFVFDDHGAVVGIRKVEGALAGASTKTDAATRSSVKFEQATARASKTLGAMAHRLVAYGAGIVGIRQALADALRMSCPTAWRRK